MILHGDRRKGATQRYADDMLMSETEDESGREEDGAQERASYIF